ncbi:putative mitochondrial protein AtMg01250 [Apium graveolens]|uniref:putative mitochondrial protein AtMg01250 n=1 Tax=Apium graveolens TaxID=4045 RepID=UPI003D7A8ECB
MQCVKTVSYSFLRNGDIFGGVVPHRGIRQGDPISPYLYILCAEGLSGMIREHEKSGLMHGCKIVNKVPVISHLLFADDCYFFLRATKSEAQTLKNVLRRYKAISGQVINYDKSEVFFSPNTPENECTEVCACLEVKQAQKPGKYLVTIYEEIERKMNAFFWGNGSNKQYGGLGMREPRKFNLSMLAKQGWRLLKENNSLVSAVMKEKYYPNSSFLDAT